METLIIKNLSKKYEIGKGQFFTALKPTNLAFGPTGLVSIVGKSGSGKSTLLNLLAMIDRPTSGEIYLNGKEYSKFKKKDITKFLNKDIGIIFQQYNLLDDQTALTNVEIPLLMGGMNKINAKAKATSLLEKVGISVEQCKRKVNKFSGGERQRVAIARAIANSPRIILCDEPTGALDSNNSIRVMEIIKEISKERLVVLVSHNLQLVNKYSDRIIEISDGKVVKDQIINKNDTYIKNDIIKSKKSSNWIDKIVNSNYKKRIKRNLFSILTFSISLTMMYLVIGFISNKSKSIMDACYKQYDFGVGSVSQEIKTGSSGTLSLTKSTRPDLNYLINETEISKKFEICPNFSSIMPQNIQISYDEAIIDGLILSPIYSFEGSGVDNSLYVKGRAPIRDDLTNIVINEPAYNLLKSEIKKEPLGEALNLKHSSTFVYVTEDENYVSDSFDFDMNMVISGVVKEINYLPTPKIYYSYSAFEDLMKEKTLNNLSTYYNEKITWYDRVSNADNNAFISSYSYMLFLKDYKDRSVCFDESLFTGGLVYNSQSILLTNSLISFLDVAEYGVILFLIITFVGSILILSIMSFTSFSEDHKNSAILTSLGASQDQIEEIYLEESILNGVISFVVSTISAIGLTKLINRVIYKFVDLENLISIPFNRFLNIKYLLPFLVFVGIIIIVSLSTSIPIFFSKRKTIKGELQSL